MFLRWLWLRVSGRQFDYVSDRWLSHQDRQSSRVLFEGPRIKFPIRKLINESPRWNAARLRRQA